MQLSFSMSFKNSCKESSLIRKLCERELDEGYVSALPSANPVYVMKKELSPVQI